MTQEKNFKNRLDVLKNHLEKGGAGSGRRNIFNNTKKGEELAKDMVVVKKSTPEETRAYMGLRKNIAYIEGFIPMNDDEVLKEFDSIPEVMKSEENRPPKSWWDTCMKKAGTFADDPKTFTVELWYKGKPSEKKEEESGIGRGGKPRHEHCDEHPGEKGVSQGGKPQHIPWRERFGSEISECMKSSGGSLADAVLKSIVDLAKDDEEFRKYAQAALAALPAIQGEAQGIGQAVNELFTPSGNQQQTVRQSKDTKKKSVDQKAVAVKPEESTKDLTDKRKPSTDEGGESEVKGDPTKGNVDDLKPTDTMQDMQMK